MRPQYRWAAAGGDISPVQGQDPAAQDPEALAFAKRHSAIRPRRAPGCSIQLSESRELLMRMPHVLSVRRHFYAQILGCCLSPVPPPLDFCGRMSAGRVLVTGANGFLGCHLLAALQRHGVGAVRAFVRAEDRVAARQKLFQACHHHQLRLNLEAVEVIAGDLGQPGLGMAVMDHERLLAGVDLLLHGGAQVNFFSSPEVVQRTNVDGTAQLMDLAVASGVRRCVLLSSLAVCNGFSWPAQQPIPEQPIGAEPSELFSPYARSKLAAEQLCFRSSAAGTSMAVLRLPYLLASREAVSLNPHGYLDVVLRAALRLGWSFDDDFSLHVLPVDLCADWVVRLALSETPPAPVVHVVADPPLRWSDWLEVADTAGLIMELEPMASWFERLRQASAACGDPELLAAYAFLSLEPSHQRWMHVPSHRLPFANTNLCALVPEAGHPLPLSNGYKIAVLRQLVAGSHREAAD